jgi:hypothetical protein
MSPLRGAALLPKRAELAGCTVAVLHHGNRRNPDVLLVDRPEGRIVVKDFAARGPWVRATLGPWITSREVRAYRRLQGHPAVPRYLGRIDRLAFAVEFRPGRRMSRKLAGTVPDAFADEVGRAVRSVHERGVVHLDLRHRSNVMVGKDGHPVLIDFASSICFRPGSWAARILLPWLARIDLRAVEKWRKRLIPQAPSPASGDVGSSEERRRVSRPT